MTRSELEHIIRAAGTIADDTNIAVIGSQSILGQFPYAPVALLISMEADVYPRHQQPHAAKPLQRCTALRQHHASPFALSAHGESAPPP